MIPDWTNICTIIIYLIVCVGLTLFEAGGGGPLPKNGPQWHAYRDGHLPGLPQLSREFNQLLKVGARHDTIQALNDTT